MRKIDFIIYADKIAGTPDFWCDTISRVLKVNPRTVRRWAGGEYDVPDFVELKLKKIVEDINT